jgi:alpha-mannosidase
LAEIPSEINTAHYVARIDPATGDLLSVKAKPSGRELLGGPANVLVAEKATRPTWYAAGDNLLLRPERPRLASSQDFPAALVASESDVAVTIEVGSVFHGGGASRRILRFNKNYPRIDFETELNDLPDQTVVVAEFPLADIPREIRRGVPFGFSHGAWPEPRAGLDGITAGILPAVRWSDYELPDGAGLALLDRGLPGREITGRTPVLFLYNAVEKYYGYPNPWLSGAGTHRLHYALAVRDTPWAETRIPRIAWEYNCPPITVPAATDTAAAGIRTSDNVIVEVMRRDGAYLELRLIESQGLPGEARVAIDLPHTSAALTDFNGERPQPLAAGPEYRFPVRPQQIVTLRLKTAPVPDITPLTDWTPLVPEPKRPALHAYHPEVVGHPPRGD